MYDLGNTGTIDHIEISALLVAMLKENPALKLPESVLEKIVDQARERPLFCPEASCALKPRRVFLSSAYALR